MRTAGGDWGALSLPVSLLAVRHRVCVCASATLFKKPWALPWALCLRQQSVYGQRRQPSSAARRWACWPPVATQGRAGHGRRGLELLLPAWHHGRASLACERAPGAILISFLCQDSQVCVRTINGLRQGDYDRKFAQSGLPPIPAGGTGRQRIITAGGMGKEGGSTGIVGLSKTPESVQRVEMQPPRYDRGIPTTLLTLP